MAILEINLEKPALVEEYRYPGETTAGTAESGTASESKSDSSGGGKGKLVGLFALVAGVGLLAWKLKNRGGTEQTDFEEFESQEYEHGPEPEIGGDDGGGAKRKVAGVLGLVVAVASLAAVVRKRRN